MVVAMGMIPLAELHRGVHSLCSSQMGRKHSSVWLSEGAVDLQPFFTDTVLKKKEAAVFMAGPFFSTPPPRSRWPDRYCRNKSKFRREDKAGRCLEARSDCPRCLSPPIVAKETHASMDVCKLWSFSNKPPRNNHQTIHRIEPGQAALGSQGSFTHFQKAALVGMS